MTIVNFVIAINCELCFRMTKELYHRKGSEEIFLVV